MFNYIIYITGENPLLTSRKFQVSVSKRASRVKNWGKWPSQKSAVVREEEDGLSVE